MNIKRCGIKKTSILAILLIVVLGPFLYAQAPKTQAIPKKARRPAVAGAFYPGNRLLLQRQVDGFLAKAKKVELEGKLVALISPHAGYIYSGPVAAYAYKQLTGRDFDTVILIGPSHRAGFAGASVYNQGSYQTPLGLVEVDFDLASKIIAQDKSIRYIPQAHVREHSLEVQLPFLQRTLKDFKIIPILISEPSLKNCRILADAIFKSIKGKKVLIIASTDLSHYQPYKEACRLDKITLDAIVTLKPEEVAKKGDMCGQAAVLTTILLAKRLGADKAIILKYLNSGDTAGPKDGVVGYGAVAIVSPVRSNPAPLSKDRSEYKKVRGASDRHRRTSNGVKKGEKEMKGVYSKEEREELLKIARDSIKSFLTTKKPPRIETENPKLKQKRGAFVTLRRGEALRGCIGFIEPIFPLYHAISECAISAATKDIRFPPVTEGELPRITIELSVLSPTK
ncbi:AmmeMemoRadiSam system protein B, partial [bacterium]|nr:AmmeMemoRadiSam system protein B [bacterium]